MTGLIYRQWEALPCRAVVLLIHGVGAHSGRWEFLADFFLKNEISSYAIELKNFGETNNLKGHKGSFNIYFEDIRNLQSIIRAENKGKPIFCAGESFGALIAFLMIKTKPDLFDGLICISPAFSNRLRFSFLDYISIFYFWFFNPGKQFKIPFNSGMLTRDVGYQKFMDSDSRERRTATAQFLINVLIAQIRSKLLRKRFNIPVFFLLPGRDQVVNSEVSRKVFKTLRAEDKTIIQYADMFHALSIDSGRETVFEDILKWIEKRINRKNAFEKYLDTQ